MLDAFASLASRKLKMFWEQVQSVLLDMRSFCKVLPLILATHESGLALARDYGFSLYNAMVVASALEAGCPVLWSEDFQDGWRVNDALTIRNPFRNT